MRNLRELVVCAFPYIVPVVPQSLPAELVEGEHFVLAKLYKSSPSSSSQAAATQEDQAEAAIGTLVRYAMDVQPKSPSLDPWPKKKKKESRTRALQTKIDGVGLEDFVDWKGIIASNPAEDEEMSRLAAGFTARMHKWAAGSEGETIPLSDGKRPKRFSPDEEA